MMYKLGRISKLEQQGKTLISESWSADSCSEYVAKFFVFLAAYLTDANL